MRIDIIPELIRPRRSSTARPASNHHLPADLSPRERKFYVAFMAIVSLNLFVICGALTFFALAFHK